MLAKATLFCADERGIRPIYILQKRNTERYSDGDKRNHIPGARSTVSGTGSHLHRERAVCMSEKALFSRHHHLFWVARNARALSNKLKNYAILSLSDKNQRVFAEHEELKSLEIPVLFS